MQRRNQIIFTSSRASSRRRCLQTLLRRSGPRKNSRDFFLKETTWRKTTAPEHACKTPQWRSGARLWTWSSVTGAKPQEATKNKHQQTHQGQVNTCNERKPMRPRNTSGGRFATASMAAYTEDGSTEGERKRENRRAKIRRASVTTGEGRIETD